MTERSDIHKSSIVNLQSSIVNSGLSGLGLGQLGEMHLSDYFSQDSTICGLARIQRWALS